MPRRRSANLRFKLPDGEFDFERAMQALVIQCINRWFEMVKVRPDPKSADYVKVLNAQARVVSDVMRTASAMTKSQLKNRAIDKMSELLKEIRSSEPGYRAEVHARLTEEAIAVISDDDEDEGQ